MVRDDLPAHRDELLMIQRALGEIDLAGTDPVAQYARTLVVIDAGIVALDPVRPPPAGGRPGVIEAVPFERVARVFVSPATTQDSLVNGIAIGRDGLATLERIALLAGQRLPRQPCGIAGAADTTRPDEFGHMMGRTAAVSAGFRGRAHAGTVGETV